MGSFRRHSSLLLENGLTDRQDVGIPATEVIILIQCLMCMIGNPSEQVSRVRRSRILESIDKSWVKFAEEEFKLQDDSLFGEIFQEKLAS